MLTTSEVKAHLRVDHSDDDTYIDTLTAAAYSFAEHYTNRIILQATKTDLMHTFPTKIVLQYSPVISLTSIAYNDTDSNPQTFTDYYFDNRTNPSIIYPEIDFSWPSTDESYENVVVTYEAGYSTIPDAINQAVLLIVGSLYEQRENHITGLSINKVPVSAEYLLNPYRIHAL